LARESSVRDRAKMMRTKMEKQGRSGIRFFWGLEAELEERENESKGG